MSSNPELALLARMLKDSNFAPITRGDVTDTDFLTDGGRLVYQFVANYRHTTQGAARWPSLDIVRERFKDTDIELPEPTGERDAARLVFEVSDRRARKEIADLAEYLDLSSADFTSDTLAAIQGAIDTLKRIQNRAGVSSQMDLSGELSSILVDYACGDILTNGAPWPWPSLTVATKGLHAKEFVVIAGRPKSRKTFVALSVAAHAMLTTGARVLFVSPEMPGRQILLRLVAFLASIRYTEFKDAKLNEDELARFISVAETFLRVSGQDDDKYTAHLASHLPNMPEGAMPAFIVVEGTNKPVSWIEAQIEVHQPDIVIVDSFYRLSTAGGKKSDADWKVVTQISRALKDMAMTTGVALIGTHQMNRESEGKVGSIGNMALADAIGQDADLIIRVITGKMNGEDRSALYVLGGREAPFDGVIINNKPCWDYSEICPIENIKQVEELLKREDEVDGEKSAAELRKKSAKVRAPRSNTSAVIPSRALKAPDGSATQGYVLDDSMGDGG